MNRAISVVIADDDARVRTDFARLLALEADIDVLATAADGIGALEVCRQHVPDVVVMDVRMPRMNGIEATRRLREEHGQACRILVVTTFDLDDYVLGAIRAGAAGFLLKDQAPDDLVRAVRILAAGEGMVAPRATARLLREFVPPTNRSGDHPGGLTDREIDVVRLLAQGLSNDDIATRAFVSQATVKTHVSHVLTKLGLSSRIQIVVWAYENGLMR